jgi:predicted HTH domain antitoxin
MQITLDIPDEYIQRLEPNLANLSQHILETMVVEAYKAQRLTSAEVGRILKLNRFAVDALLKQHQAHLHYTIADFNQDLQTLEQLHLKQQ